MWLNDYTEQELLKAYENKNIKTNIPERKNVAELAPQFVWKPQYESRTACSSGYRPTFAIK